MLRLQREVRAQDTRHQTRSEKTHLDLLRERDDVVLVELDDAVDVDLARRAVVEGLAVRGEVERVEARLLAEAVEERELDVGLGDERVERGAVAGADVRDERGGVRAELALGDEFSCAARLGSAARAGRGEGTM